MTPSRGLRTARSRRASGRTLTIPPVGSRAAFIDAVLAAVQAPGWAGRNWDALDDVLGDLSWLPEGPLTLVWHDPVALRTADPAAYRTALAVLRRAAGATRRRPVAVILSAR